MHHAATPFSHHSNFGHTTTIVQMPTPAPNEAFIMMDSNWQFPLASYPQVVSPYMTSQEYTDIMTRLNQEMSSDKADGEGWCGQYGMAASWLLIIL